MNWLKLLLGIISIVNRVAEYLHDQKMISEGEARAVAHGARDAAYRLERAIDARIRAAARGMPDPSNDPANRDNQSGGV